MTLTKIKFYNFDRVVIEIKKAGNQNDVSQIFYTIIILSLEWSYLTVYTREGSSLTREYQAGVKLTVSDKHSSLLMSVESFMIRGAYS